MPGDFFAKLISKLSAESAQDNTGNEADQHDVSENHGVVVDIESDKALHSCTGTENRETITARK